MIEAGKQYVGKVDPGAAFIEAGTGTVGFLLTLRAPEGAIEYTIWCSAKNKERAAKDFGTLGCDVARMNEEEYVRSIPDLIAGKEIPFGTKLEEYQGKTRVKVGYIGEWQAKRAVESGPRAVASLFGGSENSDVTF